MNQLIGNYVATEGLDDAMKIARALIECGHQVFIQLDDCNVYIVGYTDNDTSYGGSEFALINDEEYVLITSHRASARVAAAIDKVKDLIRHGEIVEGDLFEK